MTTLKKIGILTAVAVAAAAVAQEIRVELLARLTGTGSGKITWKTRDRGNEHQAELEAEGAGLAANSTLKITVGSNAPFTVTTNSFGAYRLAKRYTTTARPSISAGAFVTVIDEDSTILQSGKMQAK